MTPGPVDYIILVVCLVGLVVGVPLLIRTLYRINTYYPENDFDTVCSIQNKLKKSLKPNSKYSLDLEDYERFYQILEGRLERIKGRHDLNKHFVKLEKRIKETMQEIIEVHPEIAI